MSDLLENASKIFQQEKNNSSQTERQVGIQLKPLVWDSISPSVPTQEREEVRSILGIKLLQDNEDLKQEMNALIEILAELQASNDGREKKLSGLGSLSINSAERQLVEQEIQMLVDNFQRHGEIKGIDGEEYVTNTIMEPATPREKSIISYVTNGRPSSASSRLMTSRSLRPATSKSLPNGRGTSQEAVEAVKPFVTVFKLDSVVDRIQEILKEEQEELQSDVDYLQKCIEEEADFGCKVDNDPSSMLEIPSTSELREYGSKLKTKWLQDEQLNDRNMLMQRGPNNSVLGQVKPPNNPLKPYVGAASTAAVASTKEKKKKKNATPNVRAKKNRNKTKESKSNRRTPTPPMTPPTPAMSSSMFNFTGVGDDQQATNVTPTRQFRTKTKKSATKKSTKSTKSTKKSSVRNRLNNARDLDKELATT